MADSFARVKHIYGSEADFQNNDIVLLAGEIAFTDVNGIILGKVGDGTSLWSALDYTLGAASVPLTGTLAGQPVTGQIHFDDIALGKTYSIGIENGNGVDNMIIQSTADGINQDAAQLWLKMSDVTWTFDNTGKVTAPDVLFDAGDDLKLVNKLYVDTAVAGGVSATYVPLAGNLGGAQPVTGRIEFYNSVIDKEYNMGIVDGFGLDEFVITGAGDNVVECSVIIQSNSYLFKFEKNGRLFIPDITYGVGDETAAATKKYVDSVIATLRADLVAAGVAI